MATRTKTKRSAKNGNRRPILVGDHLVVDPRVCHGQLTFRGTRVPVDTVLFCLAKGRSLDYIRTSWPEVSAEAIEEAIRLATQHLIDFYGARRSHEPTRAG